METVLLGSILGAGYLLSRDGKNQRTTIQNDPAFRDSGQPSIYESKYLETAQGYERDLVNQSFQKARNAIETNVIPPQFNNGIFNDQTTSIGYLQKPQIDRSDIGDNVMVSPLTGIPMDKEQFSHSNMMPFFGSHVRQATAEHTNSAILENHTGMGYQHQKMVPKPLFEPSKDVHIQYGTQNTNDESQQRMNPSMYRQNELPFEQIRVGPGINQGYTALPSGGFNQDVREYVLPKTIDELRPLSRPQVSYKGRVVPGKAVNNKREQIGKVEQYKPDTFYENSEDRYLTTTGSVLKETARPEMIVRETNRKDTTSYSGSAGPAVKRNATSRGLYKTSIKTSFKTDGPRNAYSKDNWENEQFGDYGKQSIMPISNERDMTTTRTHASNVTSVVKALIAPLLDVFRTTTKETTENNIRQTGSLAGAIKNVVWDEDDTARTTLRETMDAEETVLNMKTLERNVVVDPDVLRFRTTIKETLIDDNHLGIVQGQSRTTVYDPEDLLRTTVKQTTMYKDRTGIVGGANKDQGYLTNEMEAPNTNRQFLSDYEYEGGANSMYKQPTTYDAEYNMRQNEVREGTLVGRYPTPSNTSMYVGKDTVNIDIKKLEGDQVNNREMATQKVYNSIQEIKPTATTTNRYTYDEKIIQDRIDPDILSAFKSNPYTQSLASYAY